MPPDPRLTALDALAARSGYVPVEPPVLQPAGLFLDLLGEEMRRRAFLTTDAAGTEYCLRPDYTVPVSLHHLGLRVAVGSYAYRGPVFRTDAGGETRGTGERQQAGFESFGRTDPEAADAEMLGLALESAATLGLPTPTVRLGDTALVGAMLDALALPPAWRRKLVADLRRSSALDEDLARLGRPAGGTAAASYAGFLAALDGSAPGAARAAVTDLLALAGIAPVGGRGVEEIADRFLERAGLLQGGIPAEVVGLARRFFAVSGDPDAVSAALRALAAEADLAMEAALDAFDTRTGFLAARGVEVEAIRASTAFGRTLDYYTGVVFELADPTTGAVLGGGGRYDALLQRLGAPAPVPAVGCSIWLPAAAPPDDASQAAIQPAAEPVTESTMETA